LGPIAGRWWLAAALGLGAWLLAPYDCFGGDAGGGRGSTLFMDPRGGALQFDRLRLQDMALNTLWFVPMGFMGGAWMRARGAVGLRLWGGVWVVGAGWSAILEACQHWSRTRVSSWLDVACNGAGVLVGVALHCWWCRYLARRAAASGA